MPKRLGEASVLIELKGNEITVRHGTDNTLLESFPATEGSWAAIWTGITNAKK
jgi:hypothetical protein